MTTIARAFQPRRSGVVAALLITGFGGAVALRVAAGGPMVTQSAPAGLLFAGVLTVLAMIAGVHTRLTVRHLGVGLAGGFVLCLPSLVSALAHGRAHPPAGSFAGWAFPVVIVALAEEAFLRGALYDQLQRWRGPVVAVIVTAVLFAGLHVPLYGWSAMPLDLAVGGWLGALRWRTNSWVAPGVAHVAADLAGWFLR